MNFFKPQTYSKDPDPKSIRAYFLSKFDFSEKIVDAEVPKIGVRIGAPGIEFEIRTGGGVSGVKN